MTKEEIMQTLNSIFAEVLKQPRIQLQEDSSAQNIDGWDSMANLALLGQSEKTFDIHFKMREIMKMKNVGDLCDTIYNKINP